MKMLLSDFFDKQDVDLLSDAKEARVDVQYYTDREINEETHQDMISKDPDFMVKCKQVLLRMKESNIAEIRYKLKEN